MACLKVSVHPLFFIFGIYFALTGKVFSFLAFTLTACIHEYGHYLASIKFGYELNKITLMPYGAIITGDITGLKYKHECYIALAGPLTNAIIALFFVALWWFIPEVYAYTELIVVANASLAIINLLPAYPLDGGRFLNATLSLLIGRKKAKIIVKSLGFLLATALLILFIYSCFTAFNLTILFFSVFAYIGVFSENDANSYVKAYDTFKIDLTTPKQVKKIAVDGDMEVRKLYPLLSGDYYYELVVFSGGKKLAVISGEKLINLLSLSNGYDKIKNAVNN